MGAVSVAAPVTIAPSVTTARNATLAVFAICGALFASWMSRVPDVKELLHLSTGRLGVVLLAISAGSVIGLPAAGFVAKRLGAATAVLAGATMACLGATGAAIAVQAQAPIPLVMLPLFFVGLGVGTWDVPQNLEGAAIERALGKAIMPWFHAAYSGGTVAAALIGALLVKLGVPVVWHLVVAVVLSWVGVFWCVRHFLPASPESEENHDTPGRSAWLESRTLLIGLVVLAAAFTEGVANDWMAVAFVDGHHHSKPLGVLAFATFLIFMTAGRIFGTGLIDRFGRVVILRILFGMALIGCLLVVFGGPWLAYAGTAIWGVGASLGFPVGMSAAADDPHRAHARVSTVATIGYIAFLAGPPLLGTLGDHLGILRALLVVGAMALLALLVVPATKPLVPASDD